MRVDQAACDDVGESLAGNHVRVGGEVVRDEESQERQQEEDQVGPDIKITSEELHYVNETPGLLVVLNEISLLHRLPCTLLEIR